MRSLGSWLLPGVVLGMLALAGLATWSLTASCCHSARISRPESDIRSISAALIAYKMNGGHYPSTEQGLAALITRPESEPRPKKWAKVADSVPRDPWGHEYRYRAFPEDDERRFEITSLGKDGKVGTPDDISSLDPPSKE